MATFLDVGLFNYFSAIFPALLAAAIVFALLQKTKVIGESLNVNGLISVIVFFLILLSPDLADIINTMTPWFVLVFIFAVLLILVYMFLGVGADDLRSYIMSDRPVQWFVFAIGAVIIISSVAHVYGQRALTITTPEAANETAAEDTPFAQNLGDVFFNSKVLGLMVIFLIAVFTLALLTRQSI